MFLQEDVALSVNNHNLGLSHWQSRNLGLSQFQLYLKSGRVGPRIFGKNHTEIYNFRHHVSRNVRILQSIAMEGEAVLCQTKSMHCTVHNAVCNLHCALCSAVYINSARNCTQCYNKLDPKPTETSSSVLTWIVQIFNLENKFANTVKSVNICTNNLQILSIFFKIASPKQCILLRQLETKDL